MASIRVILLAMIVWAVAKACDVVTKFRTATIITRKSYAEMWTKSIGGVNVLGLA